MAIRRISERQIDALVTELRNLAYNLWWSWDPAAQQLFHELSPFFWEHSHHNAVEVINWISGQELRGRLQDQDFFDRVDSVCRRFHAYLKQKNTWGATHARTLRNAPVAYFSAEFGLHESLKVYSGGLGILAGDHSKSASDLGLPFVGVTLFYRQGYFQQQLSPESWQQERYPTADPAKLPLHLVRDKKNAPVICSVEYGNDLLKFQAWVVEVGRIKVYLLDTNLPENDQRIRELTAHVYGGDQWTRIGQEIVLGIGGLRLLRALAITPAVFHMNEGHSAFLTLELLREQVQAGHTRDEAALYAKRHCVFTTHTPVPAGHDRFDQGLMSAAFSGYSKSLGLSIGDIMQYGRVHPGDASEPFTMTVLALRMSHHANGVSQLHGTVSRDMWQALYPGVPVDTVPIDHITNGIHVPGWAAATASRFWTTHLGPAWINHLSDARYWRKALNPKTVSDQHLWALRTSLRRELVEFARKRLREQTLRTNANDVSLFDNVLSPDALTIGFARRFATYKRAPLFFRDLEWALRILTNKDRPVQIIFAGKAHPRDDAGKHFIQQIVNISKRVDLFGRVVFLEDYDINVARHLVAGADVWLNTPRRPMEASGTSGMKIAIHGGLHCSTMDGWWREAYDGKNGWKIGEDANVGDEYAQDDRDAASLRSVLESEVIPLFYDRTKDGLPHRWLTTIRHAMTVLLPVYNTDRMVMEYTQKFYVQERRKKPAGR